MQVIKQLEEVQKTILNLENSKNYYKKQFEASIKDNEILNTYVKKLNKLNSYLIGSVIILTCWIIYLILLIK
jgi:hypothetical protein